MDALETLKKLTEEEDEDLLSIYLERAKNVILSHRFPYDEWPVREIVEIETTTDPETGEEVETEKVVGEETYVEDRYIDLQVRIAESLYNRIGMEGETSHSANGTSRSFGTDGVPLSLLREIVPYVGIPK